MAGANASLKRRKKAWTAHEACDAATEEIALAGRKGMTLVEVWKRLGISEEEEEEEFGLSKAVEEMLRRRPLRVEFGCDEVVVATECERLRALGVGHKEMLPTTLEMEILEMIGSRGVDGCELSEVQAEMREKEKKTEGKKRGGEHREPLAVDRLVHLGLVSKVLHTRVVMKGSAKRRVTANVLRLSRFRKEWDSEGEPWKRALVTALVTAMRTETPTMELVGRAPEAGRYDACWPFPEVWKALKRNGSLSRVVALINGPTPALASMKATSAMDVCRKVGAALGARLDFFLADATRVVASRGKPEGREMWCVGVRRAEEDVSPQDTTTDAGDARCLAPQWLGPTSFVHGVYDRIRAAGSPGGRTNVLVRDLGHGSAKMIEKAIGILTKNKFVELRRVTEGRAHSYLLLTPEACAAYNAWARVSARAATTEALLVVKPREEDEGASFGSKKKMDAPLPAEEVKKKKHIQNCHTAERTRRAASILATVRRHRVVDKAALLLALYRHGRGVSPQHKIDSKTWKRLLHHLVEDGEIGETRVDVPAVEGAGPGETVTTLRALDVSDEEIADFVARRIANIREEAERKAAAAAAAAAERQKKRKAPPIPREKRPRRISGWDDARRRESRERFAAVSLAARSDLGSQFEAAAARRSAMYAKRPRKKTTEGFERRKRTATVRREPATRGPQKPTPPLVVAGRAVAPLARTIARHVVAARRRHAPCLVSRVADAPRSSRDAACSRLLRRGWAKHVDDHDDADRLELPFDAILDAAANELRRSLGDPEFFARARALVLSSTSTPVPPNAGAVAKALAACARDHLRLLRDDDDDENLLRDDDDDDDENLLGFRGVGKRPREEEEGVETRSHHAAWRSALGGALFDVPWYDPDDRSCLDDRLRACLRRTVFVAVFVRGRVTCRALVEARRKSTPELDDLETAAILFDLCDARALCVDRPPPASKQSRPTIFDDDDDDDDEKEDYYYSASASLGDHHSSKTLAMTALVERDGLAAPRFYAPPDALDNFLKLPERVTLRA